MDLNEIAAIVITHLCGHPCDMDEIIKIVKKNKLYLIEDCSHAHLSTYKKRKVGTFGDIGVFSLDNNKLLAAGEGGILVTNKKFLFERALIVSDFGPRIFNQISNKNLRKFVDTGLGYKHRIHPASAAIANCELKKINYYINKRYITLKNFSKKIIKIPGISPPITRKNSTRGAFFGYRIFYNKKLLSNTSIDYFISLLQAEGMEIRKASNKPLQFLPLFTKKYGANFLKKKYLNYRNFNDYSLKNSEYFYNNTLSLPTFTFENKKLIDSYIAAFEKVCNYLKFNNTFISASMLIDTGEKSDRILNICQSLNADKYICGFGSKTYLNEEIFLMHGIEIVYLEPMNILHHQTYPKLGFIDGLSVFDYLFNAGAEELLLNLSNYKSQYLSRL